MEGFIYDLFEDLPRQGPGDPHSALRAPDAMQELPDSPRILGVGCDHGLQTIILAQMQRLASL
jgi:hypothetical protein